MRQQLASTPAEVVMANHCYGIFELATIYLSHTPPMLFEARLAIDGLGALLNGLKGRLGEAEPSLFEALSQLRLAFVQLEGAERAAAESAANVRPELTSSSPRSVRPSARQASTLRRRGQAVDRQADERAELTLVDPARARHLGPEGRAPVDGGALPRRAAA